MLSSKLDSQLVKDPEHLKDGLSENLNNFVVRKVNPHGYTYEISHTKQKYSHAEKTKYQMLHCFLISHLWNIAITSRKASNFEH